MSAQAKNHFNPPVGKVYRKRQRATLGPSSPHISHTNTLEPLRVLVLDRSELFYRHFLDDKVFLGILIFHDMKNSFYRIFFL